MRARQRSIMASASLGALLSPLILVLSVAIGFAGCSCSDKAAKTDVQISDLATETAPHDKGIDQQQADSLAKDSQADLKPDYGPSKCGGTRKLTPILIPKKAAQPCGPGCKQISWGTTPAHRFEIAGDLVVYYGDSRGNRVYLVDLKTDKEFQLHPERPNDRGAGCYLATTDGQKVATVCIQEWLDRPEFDQSITLIDPKTMSETDLLCLKRSAAADNCFPASISFNDTGIALNWTLSSCGQSTALFYPFGGKALKPLASGSAGFTHGDGQYVAWTQWKSGWPADQIVLHDLKTGKEKRVDPNPAAQWMPRIQNDKIVWVDHRNDPSGSRLNQRNSDIYLHNMTTGKTEAVTTHPALQEAPDVWGDWVVWQDMRANPGGFSDKNIDIYAKNMKTGIEYAIAKTTVSESYPRIDNGRIIYRGWDAVNKQLALFLVDLKTFVAAQK